MIYTAILYSIFYSISSIYRCKIAYVDALLIPYFKYQFSEGNKRIKMRIKFSLLYNGARQRLNFRPLHIHDCLNFEETTERWLERFTPSASSANFYGRDWRRSSNWQCW